jgi:pSer/pThr/pTyr-binding forkhead associated (FHA) protein
MNRFSVGRIAGNNLVVGDFVVSERHATIELQPGRYVITDLNSTNGTKVQGVEVTQPIELNEGDIVTFGRLDFHFLSSNSLYQLLRSAAHAG